MSTLCTFVSTIKHACLRGVRRKTKEACRSPAALDATRGVVTADLEPMSGRPSLRPCRSYEGRSPGASLAALLFRERSLPSMFLRQVSRRRVACSSSPVFSLGKKYSCAAKRAHAQHTASHRHMTCFDQPH